ncbi:MAG TPA: ADP-forming succinate--CoA ligase subunit beta [bacterium]|nr:ADP-forming succinate--CoA ligase subunit beta [bacterium]
MKIHEYQSKNILEEHGIKIPRGLTAFSETEAISLVKEIGYPCVIKAQIHAGGRGKGGGVAIVDSHAEATDFIRKTINKPLVTHQTGPKGKLVNRLLIEEAIDIKQELYVSILLDRSEEVPLIMASTEGGVEIEQVAEEQPEKIVKEFIDPGFGPQAYQLRRLAFKLGLEGKAFKQSLKYFLNLYRAFVETDAKLIENNPLVITGDDDVIALDAKIKFDDNALYKHKDFLELRDTSEEDPDELKASEYNLNYIKLDGEVGCMVNGAGLAMATMDIIKHYGAQPANFLDVGGIASSETVANGFRVLLSHSNLKSVLINIFGGIVRCDRVASGIVEAIKTLDVDIPVVIRLKGTNAEKASEILKNSDLDFTVAENLEEAAKMAVAAAD